MALAAPPKVFWEDDEYAVRPARDNDECREQFWRFMQELGWNRAIYDLETWLDPSKGRSCGMIVLEEKSSGQLIGQVAAIINKNKTGWVSMFIVNEKFRGKGLGRRLFDAVLEDFERAGTEIVGLDAVVEQIGTYERRGFVVQAGMEIMARHLHERIPVSLAPEAKGEVIDLRQVSLELLAASDQEHTGFERPDLWNNANLFDRPDVWGVAVVTKSPPQNTSDIMAWILVRRNSQGFHIGPLYAKDADSAETVLAHVVENAKIKMIRDTPMPNDPINDWTDEKIIREAFLGAEVPLWNPKAMTAFERQGFYTLGHQFVRMWRHNEATPEHSEGGLAFTGIYGAADAAIG